MLRALIHYWRVTLAVVAGAAVATAVLTGALMVGDSVRGSLRALTLERLGGVDWVLSGERFFRQELVDELGAGLQGTAVAPAILLRGSAVHASAGTRASRVEIRGVDERFVAVYGGEQTLELGRPPSQLFPSVVINEALRAELDAAVGDELVLGFGRASAAPRDTLMGERDAEQILGSLRVTVAGVVADEGIGRFGLRASQHNPFNAFVALSQLQRSLDQRDRLNYILLGNTGGVDPNQRLAELLTLDDLGLELRLADRHLTLESREFVLRPDLDRAVRDVLGRMGVPMQPVLSYLANKMRIGERLLPYSPVAAVDGLETPAWAAFDLLAGDAATLSADGILLNEWAAQDLQARPGDAIDLEYFEVGAREELIVRERRFRVEGVVAIEGLAADATLTPEYPGIQDAEDMAGWDPPFPVELELIRPADEQYWDEYRALPKAFVSYATGVELWRTRFGDTTSIRFGGAGGSQPEATAQRFGELLLDSLPPGKLGFVFRPVKAEGLRASSGATDFAGLFVGFSLFLIVAAALLVALLFSLGVEQRAGEIGLLLAVGYSVRRVRRRLLGEGIAVAAVGALIGLVLAVGYAGLMMAGLRTVWLPAVGSSRLFLHVTASSLLIGWAISVVVIVAAIWSRVGRLKRVPPPRLLAGSLSLETPAKQARLSRVAAVGSLVLALLLVGYAAVSGSFENPGLAFGAGALLLISGLGFFSWWCRSTRSRGGGVGARAALLGMAARNSAWNPGRSILSVALVASACFVIVLVGANRHEFGEELASRESGAGGFELLAEAEVPLHHDLNRPEDLMDLGFSGDEISRLEPVETVPFRTLPGDDASCLNLYRAEKPRILGVPHELIRRGGFQFQESPEVENVWELLEQPLEDGVIPAIADYNSAAWILHMCGPTFQCLGKEIELEDEAGRPVRLRLVGTLKNSVFQSELLIAERNFLDRFPSRTGYGYFLIDLPAEDVPQATRILEGELGAFGFDISTTRERLERFKVVEHTYMATFQMLGGLGLLLGTVGLGVVLLRNVLERRGELATLRAFGFRRQRLAWMILAENAFLLLVGMLLGTVAALAAVAPRLASIDVPWLSLGATLVVVLLVGMLASLAAVRGALRIPLLPALKAEH